MAVNLDPTDPSLGLIKPPLFNMHDAEGCTCELIDVTDMRINHYLGSTEDYLAKTRRFWEVWIRMPATIQVEPFDLFFLFNDRTPYLKILE